MFKQKTKEEYKYVLITEKNQPSKNMLIKRKQNEILTKQNQFPRNYIAQINIQNKKIRNTGCIINCFDV
jgi:hypothetical protein